MLLTITYGWMCLERTPKLDNVDPLRCRCWSSGTVNCASTSVSFSRFCTIRLGDMTSFQPAMISQLLRSALTDETGVAVRSLAARDPDELPAPLCSVSV